MDSPKPPNQKDWLGVFSKDPLNWGITCFPLYFRLKGSWFHVKVIDKIVESKKLAIAAPREHAKSVLISFLYVFWCIYFKKKRFIIIISNTEEKATEHVNAMKAELRDNVFLKQFFAKLIVKRDTATDTIFQHKNGFQTRVLCKGVNQIPSIRGVRFGPYRPDLILGDDIEDDELVRSSIRRNQLQEELDDVLKYAGDRTTQFLFIGTILHFDSQIAKFLEPDQYKDYTKLFFKAYAEKEREALWPEKKSVEELEWERRNNPRSFAKEMQNNPVAGTLARFKKEMFRYWKEENGCYKLYDTAGNIINKGELIDCKGAIACDLAWSEKKEADRAVMLAALLTSTNDILIYQYLLWRGLRPDKFANQLFTMVNKMKTITGGGCPVGFEKAMLEKVTQWILKMYMRERNEYIVTRELSWANDKITRIEMQLEPRYSQHVIFHRRGMGDLEDELLKFPEGKTDDIIDAEQGAVQMLKFPKGKKKELEKDDHFNWLRKNALNNQPEPKTLLGKFNLGHSGNNNTIPAKKTWR